MVDPRREGPIPLPAGRNRQPAPSNSEGADAAVALPVGLRPPGSATAAILILIAARLTLIAAQHRTSRSQCDHAPAKATPRNYGVICGGLGLMV